MRYCSLLFLCVLSSCGNSAGPGSNSSEYGRSKSRTVPSTSSLIDDSNPLQSETIEIGSPAGR